ncbi:MAG: hypothetical protein A3G20_05995 [Acidobacteria bacterium RIFCSPLOWO2_12_FULL_59_11]|nr:MAG: hypothetical protein A3G20_05995 [Acidobacteria bacterium RIFCSPLOWO2_12_FULL_59_11]
MLVELSINPLGRGTHISKDLAEILQLIDESGLPYCLTPSGTCIEGGWDEVMAVVKRCHDRERSLSSHVMTTLRIEDEEGGVDKLNENIAAVERAAGRPLRNIVARSAIKF